MYLLPHWIVNGQRTSSQFDAWRAAAPLGIKPQFYFFDDQYDQIDWTTEPKETWDQICYERCITLRQRYKKLSLFYSAGRDSHQILKCFFYFSIPLDEILLINFQTNHVRQNELIKYIYPQVNQFLRAFPNTQVTIVDVGTEAYKKYFKDDWLEKKSTAFAHSYFQPTDYAFYIKNILHADELNNGVIVGLDKPRILLEDGKYYSTVIDKTLEVYMSDIPNLEYFYYAPDMPKIHVKQTWMTLNHLEKNYPGKITNQFLIEYCGNSHSVYYDDFCISCGRGPAWNVELGIQNGKSKYKNHGREPLFQDLLKYAMDDNWEAAYNFTDAMNYMNVAFSHIFNDNDPYKGTLGIYSKKYYLKDAISFESNNHIAIES